MKKHVQVGITASPVKSRMPSNGLPLWDASHPARTSPVTRPAFKSAMKYPLIFSWSGREFTYDIDAATKHPPPIPSNNLAVMTRYGAVTRDRIRPLAIVIISPDRMRGTRP